jgi:fumarate hydratase class II
MAVRWIFFGVTLSEDGIGLRVMGANQHGLAWRHVAVYELALGGTAVGTGLNTHKDYAVKSM